MSDPEQPEEDVLSTLIIKVPFLLLGAGLGMLTVYVGLQWIPSAMMSAKATLGIQ